MVFLIIYCCKQLCFFLPCLKFYIYFTSFLSMKWNANLLWLMFFFLLIIGENLTVHRINGPYQGKILSFLASYRPQQKTLYFSRVSLVIKILKMYSELFLIVVIDTDLSEAFFHYFKNALVILWNYKIEKVGQL